MTGSPFVEFTNKDLSGARFHNVSLRGAELVSVDLREVTIRGAALIDMEITGEVRNMRVNGVDVAPLIEAELDSRQPGRAKMRPVDPAGFREAWDLVDELWMETVERARRLEPSRLHERVNGEWSFTETLRHLVFATDAWVLRVILGDPAPWDALDLPFDEMDPEPSIPWQRDARPSLDEVLALRADRMGTVRRVIDGLTHESLASMTQPVTEPGYPEPASFPVDEVLRTILNEEWHHRLFAERDLAILEARG